MNLYPPVHLLCFCVFCLSYILVLLVFCLSYIVVFGVICVILSSVLHSCLLASVSVFFGFYCCICYLFLSFPPSVLLWSVLVCLKRKELSIILCWCLCVFVCSCSCFWCSFIPFRCWVVIGSLSMSELLMLCCLLSGWSSCIVLFLYCLWVRIFSVLASC